jgi:hypothetical protein
MVWSSRIGGGIRSPRAGYQPAVDVEALIASIDERSPAEGERLLRGLLQHFWPGGPADHHRPGAVGWVQRWGPAFGDPAPPDLSPN